MILLLMIGISEATTCYNKTTTSKPYDILHNFIVETRRGCEVLCDGKEKLFLCAGFSFKDVGFSSECILLSANTLNQICAAQATIFLKQTEGCVARTNLTAEFGVDPCIDEMVPIEQALGAKKICPVEKDRLYIIRAIDANGVRLTLDNDYNNWLEKSGDLWVYRFDYGGKSVRTPVIAAACALAGGNKCPCEPIRQLTEYAHRPTNYAPVLSKWNPCNADTKLYVGTNKIPTVYVGFDSPQTEVTCKAGMWILWYQPNYNSVGIQAAHCYK